MGQFHCPNCGNNCCTCQGCHPQTAVDGKQCCSKCVNIRNIQANRKSDATPNKLSTNPLWQQILNQTIKP